MSSEDREDQPDALLTWCQQYFHPGKLFVDIGAGKGSYSLYAAPYVSRVIAFEVEYYSTLQEQIWAKQVSNITAHNSLLTKETLDSFSLREVGFLRLAVPAAAVDIIRGAQETLRASNYPPIFLTIRPEPEFFPEKEALFTYLQQLGYHLSFFEDYPQLFLARDCIPWDMAYQRAQQSCQEQKYELAYRWAHRGLRVLAKHPPAFRAQQEYLLLSEITQAAWHMGKREEGLRVCEQLILSPYTPGNYINTLLFNRTFYLTPLPVVWNKRLPWQAPPGFFPSTPSLTKTATGYLVNIRVVNYTINPRGSYSINDSANIIRTRNFLVTLDEQLEIQGSRS
jgi:hypothetical protein